MVFFEFLVALLLGVFAGIFTGLTPGIHINLVAVLTLTSSPVLLKYTTPLILVVFIISMAVTHTFLDFIPSVFLGAPDPETALSVLPAHRLLLEGKGYEAIQLTTIGSLFGIIITVALAPIIMPSVKIAYPLIQKFIPYILITASLFLILKDSHSKIWSLISFLMAGVLGIIVLSMPNLEQPLLPLLSGLFGISILLISLKDKVILPQQKITQTDISKKEMTKALSSSFISSSLSGFLPGLGAAQAAIIGSSMTKLSTKGFILLVGAIGTIVMSLSFIAIYIISRARNGAVVVISKILENINLNHLILFLAVTLIVAGIATFLSLNIAKIFSKLITKINYKLTCIIIIIFITILTIILSGFLGFLILIVSTSVGLIPSLKGIGKNHLMGCLILPVILFFLL